MLSVIIPAGVTQKTDPISSNGSDIRATKLVSQIFESPSPVQEDHTVSNNKKPQTQHVPTSNLRAHTAPCIRNPSISLAKSLTGLISLRQAKVHILGVGTSWEGQGDRFEALPGPSHDIEWLKNAFAHQQNFWFNSLLDHNVTLATIRQSLDRMFSVAEESDLLALYFSGHGGYDDRFELYDSTSLDEVILNEWIVEFRSKNSAHNPVYIVFDFCRPGRVRPQAELASDVKVIWACSPTQPALELKLKDPNNALPRSCFLLSLILAIGDVSEDPTLPAVGRFTDRMKQLVKTIRGLACYRCRCRLPWRFCGCNSCVEGGLCPHDQHGGDLPFQVVSIGGIDDNSDFSVFVDYVASSFPLHIKRAADQVAKSYWMLYFNPSPLGWA
ncbi:unnamed protein product [Rhizoctonia solani]|uniref:Peptidase C14 caspase domain-containing protein n=1 Tax=Rhizoctonia solani TaxID=456999 RepID=A0A8H2WH19_9AGAM|nr:unnamed protein product [Rhizoctonia solani]